MPAHDLALWDISLIDRSLLEPASYEQMFTPVLLKSGTDTGYGLGVDLGKREGHKIIEHSGEVSGFVSENVVFPDDRAAIVVLTNEMATQAARSIADRIMPIVLGIPTPVNELLVQLSWRTVREGRQPGWLTPSDVLSRL